MVKIKWLWFVLQKMQNKVRAEVDSGRATVGALGSCQPLYADEDAAED